MITLYTFTQHIQENIVIFYQVFTVYSYSTTTVHVGQDTLVRVG